MHQHPALTSNMTPNSVFKSIKLFSISFYKVVVKSIVFIFHWFSQTDTSLVFWLTILSGGKQWKSGETKILNESDLISVCTAVRIVY